MKSFQLILSILLAPFTVWYAVGVAFRNLYYDRRDKKNERKQLSTLNSKLSTIGIGNLRMGGTGKTPHTEYLIRLLQLNNSTTQQISLLSRGYRRKTKGFLLADNNSTAAQIGDEPLMMHRKFPGISVAVCEDRAEGLRQLHNSQFTIHNSQNIVLLDDSYQHRRIRPDLNILLTEYGDLYADDHILPFGNLREFRCDSRRADIIIVTKCPRFLSKKKQESISKRLNPRPNQKLFFSYIDYSDPLPLFPENEEPRTLNSQPSTLNSQLYTLNSKLSTLDSKLSTLNSQLLLVSGIANPEPLKRHLERHSTVTHLNFPDHHNFTRLDCELIVKKFNNIKNPVKAIVTTEKDAMRLKNSPHSHLFNNIPFYYIPIEVKFFEQNDFDNTIIYFFHTFATS